jgi:hypothetical protein
MQCSQASIAGTIGPVDGDRRPHRFLAQEKDERDGELEHLIEERKKEAKNANNNEENLFFIITLSRIDTSEAPNNIQNVSSTTTLGYSKDDSPTSHTTTAVDAKYMSPPIVRLVKAHDMVRGGGGAGWLRAALSQGLQC